MGYSETPTKGHPMLLFAAIIAAFVVNVFVAVYVTRRIYMNQITALRAHWDNEQSHELFMQGWEKGYEAGIEDGTRRERFSALYTKMSMSESHVEL